MSRQNRIALLLIVLGLMLALISCGGGDDDDDDSGTDDDDAIDDDDDAIDDDDDDDDTVACESGKSLTFGLTNGKRNIPYPSMIFSREDPTSPTGIRVHLEGQTATFLDNQLNIFRFFTKGLNELDGFGVSTPAWFPVNAPPDKSLLPDSIDPDTDDAIFCAVIEDENHPYHGAVWRLDVEYVADQGLLRLTPRLPFLDNTAYACVATDTLRTSDGECYQQPDHLAYVMRSQGDPEHPEYDLLEPAREILSPGFAELFGQYGLSPDRVIGATVFRTQWITHDLMDMRKQMETLAVQSPPQVNGDWVRIDRNHPNVDSVWEVTYDTVGWQKRGALVYDADGDPVMQAPQQVTMRLTLPKTGINGYDPPFPVVTFAPGIHATRTQATALAETLAGYGFATAAIDLVYHGAREQGIGGLPDWLAITVQTIQWVNFIQPLKMSGNVKQGASDFIWLKHVLRGLDDLDLAPYATGGDQTPDLDPSHIYFSGMSLGSINGAVLPAIEPDFEAFLFNVGGANWKTVALDGEIGEIILAVLGFIDPMFKMPVTEFVQMQFDLVMSQLEPGDPYAYGIHVLEAPLYDIPDRKINILQQMAAYDETLGGPAGGDLSRTLGLTLIEPYVWRIEDVEKTTAPFYGPAVFQYDTDNHGILFPTNEFDTEVHLQLGTFFRTAYDNGTATIINPFQ